MCMNYGLSILKKLLHPLLIGLDFLKTSAWNFKYRFDDQILIYAQKPNAKACAEYDTWNQ